MTDGALGVGTHLPIPKGQTAQSDFMRLSHVRQRKRRRLDGEDGIDFVRCLICGDRVE
jgi:hypothetical protein